MSNRNDGAQAINRSCSQTLFRHRCMKEGDGE